jgi:hypothetical protein
MVIGLLLNRPGLVQLIRPKAPGIIGIAAQLLGTLIGTSN